MKNSLDKRSEAPKRFMSFVIGGMSGVFLWHNRSAVVRMLGASWVETEQLSKKAVQHMRRAASRFSEDLQDITAEARSKM